MEDVKHVQRVVKLFLISWGMMNRVVGRKNLNWKKLGNSLRRLESEFAILRDKRFLTVGLFDDKTVSDAIKKIYRELDPIPYLGSPTTISKILHLLNPEIFIMWDTAIISECHRVNSHVNNSANGYLEFMKESQKAILATIDEFERATGKTLDMIEKEMRTQHHNKTITKIIDEYNWMTANP